jgi:predicted nucleic acid-binding protein
MDAKVLDSSALCAIIFQEREAVEAHRRVDGCRMIVPDLLPFEVTNVFVKKVRTGVASLELLHEQFLAFLDTELEYTLVDFDRVSDMALQMQLTVYDASYLFLAASFQLELITFDKKLLSAAAQLGVRV